MYKYITIIGEYVVYGFIISLIGMQIDVNINYNDKIEPICEIIVIMFTFLHETFTW